MGRKSLGLNYIFNLQLNPHYYKSINQLFSSKVLFYFCANFAVFPECIHSSHTKRITKNKSQENTDAYSTDSMVHVAVWTG
jgi:hypothetical protein